jgi:hypothetical protein
MTTQANSQELEALRVKLREEMNELTNHLAAGGCKDIEEYRSVTGEITGLAKAERELLDLDIRLTHD